MIDGILLIDKEVGITSYDAIRKLKRVFEKDQKIGHGGTLDPFASGLLLILLGRGTKLLEKIHSLEKEYIVNGEFGFSTDTQDITGKVLERNDFIPQIEKIKDVVKKNFLGSVLQTPPIYSAKKVNGKRSYELVRKGESVELRPKEIFIKEFEILKYEYPNIECRVVCGSGTYVRTLINDLGIKVGTFATATELRRISIGRFYINNSFLSSNINEENIGSILSSVIDISKVNEVLSNGER